jgi:hypothetical protein
MCSSTEQFFGSLQLVSLYFLSLFRATFEFVVSFLLEYHVFNLGLRRSWTAYVLV